MDFACIVNKLPIDSIVPHNFLAAGCDQAGDDADVGAGREQFGVAVGEERVGRAGVKAVDLAVVVAIGQRDERGRTRCRLA